MPQIGRKELVLLVLGLSESGTSFEGVGGITRLQKLLFLLEQEAGLQPTGDGFEFVAYKAGPCSRTLYDDLEFLENLGYIESEIAAEATEPEAAEIDVLSFDQLIGDDGNLPGDVSDTRSSADAYEERRFRLTRKGLKRIEGLLKKPELAPLAQGIRRIKSKYSKYSLTDLLYHVYTKYPKMATESEIRDKVLRRGRRT
jgi:hypothetical protein